MKALITTAAITMLTFGGAALADQYEEFEKWGYHGGLTDTGEPQMVQSMEDMPATAAGKSMRMEDDQDGFNLNGPFPGQQD